MKLIYKFLFLALILTNAILGYFAKYTSAPVIFIILLSMDLFLLFYYVRTLFRANYGLLEFEKKNLDLIKKAQKEVGDYQSKKQ